MRLLYLINLKFNLRSMKLKSEPKAHMRVKVFNFSRKGQLYIESIERQHTVQYDQ